MAQVLSPLIKRKKHISKQFRKTVLFCDTVCGNFLCVYSIWEDCFGKRSGTISFFTSSSSAFWAPKPYVLPPPHLLLPKCCSQAAESGIGLSGGRLILELGKRNRRTKNQPKEEVFGMDIPRISGGHSRGYPGPKLRCQGAQNPGKTSICARTFTTRRRGHPRP